MRSLACVSYMCVPACIRNIERRIFNHGHAFLVPLETFVANGEVQGKWPWGDVFTLLWTRAS